MKRLYIFLSLIAFSASTLIAQTSCRFTENKGQLVDQYFHPREDILFNYFKQNFGIYFSGNGFSYQLVSFNKKANAAKTREIRNVEPSEVSIHRVDVSFFGSNPGCVVSAKNEYKDYDNYYSDREITFVKSYKDLLYKNLYNGVDLHYYAKENNFKYDFIVAAGADPSQIALDIKGADKLEVKDGKLIISTSLGDIIEQAPVAYQGNKKVKVQWILNGNKVSFKLGDYDRLRELIIDPLVLVRHWGTYYGGTGDDEVLDLKIDQLGNVYASGYADSYQNIVTVGAFQTSKAGGTCGFIVKFNSAGVRQWGTYYNGGGNSMTFAIKLAIDKNNDIYTVDTTAGTITTIASAGAFQPNYGGGQTDAFYAKFNPAGVRLYATFYGGSGLEEGNGIAVDSNKNVYIVGGTGTASGSAIASPGAFQTVYNGGVADAYLAKFDSSGNRLWGTLYGGSGSDYNRGVTLDRNEDVYFFGYTSSQSNISTPGSHQPTFGGYSMDAYLVKFSANGTRCWATYYGGSNDDLGLAIAADSTDGIYIGGYTYSTNFGSISTPGSYQPTKMGNGANQDLFIAKIDTSGVRQWGTYYGGTNTEDFICLNFQKNLGYLLVGGYTDYNAADNPPPFASPGGHQQYFATGLYSIFDVNGNRLHSSYYGGGSAGIDNSVMGVAMNNQGELYIGGGTQYSTYYQQAIYEISTAGSHQPLTGQLINSSGSLHDGYIAKFGQCPVSVSVVTIGSPSVACPGNTTAMVSICASGGSNITYYWANLPSGASVFPSANSSSAGFLGAGIYTCQVTNTCGSSVTHTVEVTQPAPPNVTVTATPTAICAGDTCVLKVSGAQNYYWLPGPYIANWFNEQDTIYIYPQSSVIYTVFAASNSVCVSVPAGTINIPVYPQFSVQITPAVGFSLVNDTVNFAASPATSYSWSTGDTTSVINYTTLAAGFNWITVIATNSMGCKATDSAYAFGHGYLSIKEYSDDDRKIYPNPTSGLVFIEGIREREILEITDVTGRLVYKTQGPLDVIDLSHYDNGVYMLNISSDSSSRFLKIVKE